MEQFWAHLHACLITKKEVQQCIYRVMTTMVTKTEMEEEMMMIEVAGDLVVGIMIDPHTMTEMIGHPVEEVTEEIDHPVEEAMEEIEMKNKTMKIIQNFS